MSEYLDRINEANDIKKIEPEAYDALASEIRSFIISDEGDLVVGRQADQPVPHHPFRAAFAV